MSGFPINWFDIIAAGMVILGVFLGRRRGMSGELLDLITWLLVVFVGAWLYQPVGRLMVDTMGTGRVDEDTIRELIRSHFALTPADIIKSLDLRRPIFKQTAAYGHFGRNEEGFTWEKTDKAEGLKKDAGL